MKYRRDIDGLRAVAILPVIFYHLNITGFKGGYVGVDIFFVISGFLITSLIVGDLRQGSFSVLHFYERRIRRIFPALSVMVAATIPIALLLLLPGDLTRYAESLTATSLFSSNMLFWMETGYFDAAAQMKPLLHTWSLAVEEQFYLLFPLVLAALRFIPERRARIVLSFLGIAAFIGSLYVERNSPGAVFFLAPFRAWELLLGAVAAMLPAPQFRVRTADFLSAGGLIMIFIVVAMGGENAPFPTLTVKLPAALGALGVILAGGQSRIGAGPILRSRLAVAIGKRSYSAYLWHWPLIAFGSYYFLGELSALQKALVLLLTALLAWASYLWVETSVRGAKVSRSFIFGGALTVTALFSSLGLAGYFFHGLPSRFAVAAIPSGLEFYNRGPCFYDPALKERWSVGKCTFAGPTATSPSVWLLGDSFGAHLLPGLRALQADLGFTLVQATFGACPPLPAITDSAAGLREECNSFNQRVAAELVRAHPQLVILSARWEAVADQKKLKPALVSAVETYQRAGINVLVVGLFPTYGTAVPLIDSELKRRGRAAGAFASEPKWLADELVVRASALQTKADFFSPLGYWCQDSKCRYSDEGGLFEWDFGHLSRHGSEVLTAAMAPQIRSILARKPS